MTNDECKQVYDAAQTLPEDGALAAVAAFVGKFGPTMVLAMLTKVCMTMEQVCQQQEAQKAQGDNVIAFRVPGPGSDKLN